MTNAYECWCEKAPKIWRPRLFPVEVDNYYFLYKYSFTIELLSLWVASSCPGKNVRLSFPVFITDLIAIVARSRKYIHQLVVEFQNFPNGEKERGLCPSVECYRLNGTINRSISKS